MHGFQLNARQEAVLKAWVATLDQDRLQAAFEEDCVPQSPLTFKYWAGGIGDHIEVECQGQILNLSIDDDNEGAWPKELGHKYFYGGHDGFG